MPEYTSGRKRKQNIGISSFSENTDSLNVIGNVLISSGRIGIGSTLPARDVDVTTIRIRDTVYDYTNYGGDLGYYLVKDTNGIKWVAVPPIDSNAIFIAENNNILGVSSFTGLNIVSDELLGISTNTINPNFADITIDSRWSKSGNTGIYTTKNVGIGTTIPIADFQVGYGTNGVIIDGTSGVITAIGYVGDYLSSRNIFSSGISTLTNLVVPNTLNVTGLGTTFVDVYLSTSGGITTTGGDLYVGKKLYAGTIDIDTVVVNNVNSPGVSTFNVSYTNLGIVTYLNVTGIATIKDLNVTGFSTLVSFSATTGVVTDLNATRLSSNTLVVSGITTLGNASASGIVTSLGDLYVGGNLYTKGIQYFDSIGAQYLDVLGNGTINVADINIASIDYTTGIGATITRLNSTSLVSSAASFSTLNVSGVSTFSSGPVFIGSGTSTGTSSQQLQITGGGYISGSLGIGTTLPTQSLDLISDLRVRGQIYDRFNSAGAQGAVLTSDPINASWYWAAPPPFQIGILTALDDVTYYPTLRTTGIAGTGGIGSASYLQIDDVVTSALSYKINPARLGIGTTNPTTPLHVIGDALVNGWGYFNRGVGIGTTSIVELRHYNVNNGTFSVNNYGGNQMFSVSNVIDNTHEFKINQYLGIGTATRSVFTVDNNGSVSSLFPVNIAVGQSNNYQSQFNSVIWGEVNIRAPYTAIGSSSVIKIVPKYQDLGALSFESPVGTALTDRGTQIFSISNNLTSTIFRINDTNRNTILEATSSGNVGIGTTLPARKFQVTGTTRITSVGSTTNEQIDINHYRNTAYPLAGSQPTTNRGALSFDSLAGISTNGLALFPASLFAITNDPTGNIFSVSGYRYFSGSTWPVIDVTQRGRLGIGTTTPQEEVHITRNTLINADVRIIDGISSNVTIGGSVGIGTTSLFVGLDVNTNSQFRSRVAFSQTANPASNNVFDFIPVTTGITSWAPPGGALVMTGNRNNSGQTSGQIYTLENNDETLFRVNTIGFGLTTLVSPTNPIYQVIDVNPAGDIRLFDTETRKILSTSPGFSSTTPGDGDFLRIDTYTTPFIGSFPTVSKAIRLDKFGLIELNRNVRQISGNTVIGSSATTGTSSQNLQVVGGAYVSSNVGIGTTLPRARLDVEGSLNVTGVSTVGLGSTSSPLLNSSFSFELTNNTTLTLRVRGTDGVVRTGIITLA